MDSRPTYQPLPGHGFGPFRRDRLWLADDHLLSVRSSRIVDIYERFYFGDIQGIYFRERRGEHLMIVAALVTPCLALLALAVTLNWAWLIPLAPIAAWTVAYAWLGSQADCHVRTLLGTHPLPAVSRRRAYEHLLERVAPLIEAAQGPLDPAAMERVSAPPAHDFAPPPMEHITRTKPPVRGWYLELTFGVVALAGIYSLWNQRGVHGLYFDWAEYGLSFAGMLMALFAVAWAYRVDVGGAVLGCLWSIIGTQAVYSVATAVVAAVQNAPPQSPGRLRYDQHPIRSIPDLLPYATAMELLCLGLAVVGLLLVIDRKNRQPG